MNKNFLLVPFVLILYFSANSQEAQQPDSTSETLMDQFNGWIKKHNPFGKETKPPANGDSVKESVEVSEANPDQEKFQPNVHRWHFSIGLGNVALQSNSRSVLEKNYNSSAGAQLGITYETPVSESGSFETGIGLLSLNSDLKGTTSTDMSLSYIAIPLVYKHIVSKIRSRSSLYLKGGLTPLALLSASVDTCSSAACGLDNDLDAWLTKSRSISDSFQNFSLLGSVGVGFNMHLFSDVIVDSLWLTSEVSYLQGLTSINKGNQLGDEVTISGALVNIGVAASF